MAYTLDLNKLIKEVRGPKGMAAVTEEASKLKTELEKIRKNVEPKVEQKLKQTQARLLQLKKELEGRQKKIEKDIAQALVKVKKRAQEAEKHFEAALKGKKGAAAKKTSKKVATSKKKTSKKSAKA